MTKSPTKEKKKAVPGITVVIVTVFTEGVQVAVALLPAGAGHDVETEVITDVVGSTVETEEVTIVCVDWLVCSCVVVKVGTVTQDIFVRQERKSNKKVA